MSICEVCYSVMSGDDLDDEVSVPADCCGRIGLCADCREEGEHDCDEESELARRQKEETNAT